MQYSSVSCCNNCLRALGLAQKKIVLTSCELPGLLVRSKGDIKPYTPFCNYIKISTHPANVALGFNMNARALQHRSALTCTPPHHAGATCPPSPRPPIVDPAAVLLRRCLRSHRGGGAPTRAPRGQIHMIYNILYNNI